MSSAVQLMWIDKAEAQSFRRIALSERTGLPHVADPSATLPGLGWRGELHALAFRAGRAVTRLWSRAFNPALQIPFAADADDTSFHADSERRIVAILISDIVGSTEWAARLGDYSWRRLLDRHDAATRQQIGRFGGQEIRNCGDGFLVIFNSATHAIRCAAAICEAVAPLGLCVRSGIHTGEVHLNGNEITGIAAHIAARIAAIALPSEVVVSSTVRDLAAASPLNFVDRGAYLLRGVPEETHLYSMRLAGDGEGPHHSCADDMGSPRTGAADKYPGGGSAKQRRRVYMVVPADSRSPSQRPRCSATKLRQLGGLAPVPRAG